MLYISLCIYGSRLKQKYLLNMLFFHKQHCKFDKIQLMCDMGAIFYGIDEVSFLNY